MNGCRPIGNDGADADRRRVTFAVAMFTGGRGGGGGDGSGVKVEGLGIDGYRGSGATTRTGVGGAGELATRL